MSARFSLYSWDLLPYKPQTDILARYCYFLPSVEILADSYLRFRFAPAEGTVGLTPTRYTDRMATRVQDSRTYSPRFS